MNRSIAPGAAHALTNNTFVGEAYAHQLLHQPSTTELARQRIAELAEQMEQQEHGDERTDDDEDNSRSTLSDFIGFDVMADFINNIEEGREMMMTAPISFR